MNNSRSRKVATLTTNDPIKSFEVKVTYDDSLGRKYYRLNVMPIEDKDNYKTYIVVMGCRGSIKIPDSDSPRFSAKKLETFAANWQTVPGLAELVIENAISRKVELSAESKKLVGIANNSLELVYVS